MDADLPLLHEWHGRPHVAEWWGGGTSLVELEREYGADALASGSASAWMAMQGDSPIGFIQVYVPADTHADGWWLAEHDRGVRGIDQFLAHGDRLGRGLGTAMVRAFVAKLFVDPSVTRVQVDPSPDNACAIRCYEKAGFRAVSTVTTPDGPALLMYRDRDR